MATTLTDILKDERIHDGLALFGSLYARRLLEDPYDRLMNTPVAEKLKALNRPTKLGIEAAVNLLAACVSSNEAALTDKPWKKFAFEVLMDAPSELNKRLLNGEHGGQPVPDSISKEEKAALHTLRELDPYTTETLLAWLRTAGSDERQKLVEYLASLVPNAKPAPSTPVNAARTSPRLLADFAKRLSSVNETLEQQRKPK